MAVVGLSPSLNLSAITQELVYCLQSMGTVKRITPEVVVEALGPTALEPGSDFKLTAWLGAQEDHHETVIYQCSQDVVGERQVMQFIFER